MAVIGKIREKSALLLIIIGGAMMAFILGDFMKSGRQFFGADQNNIGEIGGVKISGIEFENKVKDQVSAWENQNQTSADSKIRDAIREQVWNTILRDQIYGSQFKELGLGVSPEELFDMVQGNDPHPQVKQIPIFQDKDGSFSSTKALQFLKNLDNQPEEQQAAWHRFEEGLMQDRENSKYNNLIIKGMYATSYMIKNTYKEQKESRNIRYVAKRYVSVPDSIVNVTDEELKAYYNAHKKEYQQDASRDIEYVKFVVEPSEADRKDAKDYIDEITKEFKASNDDSSFVAFNSDEPMDEHFYDKATFPINLDSTLFYADTGTVVGPYEENDAFVLAKLSKIKMVPDSVRARHILLKEKQQGDSTIYKKIDSLKTLIKNGASFESLAKDYSEDVSSAIKGGDLGWFKEGAMVPPFNDACFNGKVGDLVIVESQFGYHLIEIMNQGSKVKKVQVAKVVKKITPSSKTFDSVFAQASAFYSANNNSAEFEKSTATDKYNKLIAKEIKVSDKNIAGLQDARELIRWTFNNDKDAISAPMQFDNVFVVAHISEVREKGTATMDQVAVQVELGAKKQKKAEQFKKEMEGLTDLYQLADKLKEKVDTLNGLTFSAYAMPKLGQEPNVIGLATTLQQGQTSKPIEGKTGVFVITVDAVNQAPEIKDYTPFKTQLNSQYAGTATQVFDALKEKFGVIDKRYKFY